MFAKYWKKLHGSVCSISFMSDNGIKLAGATGFRVGQNIITDEIIYKFQKCEEVIFQFIKSDGYTASHSIHLSYADYTARINRLAEFEEVGFALISFENEELLDIDSLELETESDLNIGETIFLLGYTNNADNLCIKNGIISSFFINKKGKKYIQFDASIVQGNSGSPLFNAQGKVIGVVGYRLSTITQTYDAFKNIIDENLKLLKKSEGLFNIMDVDPIQVLIANQNQLKLMSKEFYKSAIMSFGYAHLINNITKYTNGNILVTKVKENIS
jgi:hypothetical protein